MAVQIPELDKSNKRQRKITPSTKLNDVLTDKLMKERYKRDTSVTQAQKIRKGITDYIVYNAFFQGRAREGAGKNARQLKGIEQAEKKKRITE